MAAPIDEFPSRPRLLLRGLTRRCAWCGDQKAYFLSWFKRQDQCHRCGPGYRRGDAAFELGATTANIMLTFGTLLFTMLVMIVVTAPDVPVTLITVVGAGIALAGPIVFYPFSFTLWQAVDLWMRRPTPQELAGEGDATL